MDPQLFKLARQLQTQLALIDDQTEPGTFQSVHGLLIEFIDCLETAMPALRKVRERAETKANLEEVTRLLKEIRLKRNLPDDPDSLDQIERQLEGEDPSDPVGVPAKRKPGPKGLSGGVALPLPNNDLEV